jgi:hypothetical protein
VGGEGWGGTSDGGEELGLGEAEADAVGAAKAVKLSDVEREVDVAEGGAGVINVGQVSGGREGVGVGGGTRGKGAAEFGEDFVEDASVNINASYIEALLGKKQIRCKIYFLRTFFIYRGLLI